MTSTQKSLDSLQYLQQAIALHRSGQLAEAASMYKKLLKTYPKQPVILTNLATIAMQEGRYIEGIRLIEKSIKLDSNQPNAHMNRGIGLHFTGRYEQAMQSYNRAIALNIDYAEAYYNRGTTLNALGRFEEALASYDRALLLVPHYAEAYTNRGIVLYELKRFEEAVQSYEQALIFNPNRAEAYFNRGVALNELGHEEEALLSYEQAILLKPDYTEAYGNLGEGLYKLKHYELALQYFDNLIALKPQFPWAYEYRGMTLDMLDRPEEALQSYDQTIALDPNDAKVHSKRGTVLDNLKRYQEALQSHDRAIELSPEYADGYNNRAVTLHKLKRFNEALQDIERAIALNTEFALAYFNRGNFYVDLKRFDKALHDYNKAIELDSDYAEAFWNKSILKLIIGDFTEGWALYEWRWKTEKGKQDARKLPQIAWLGEASLANKTLLIYPEQGLGDFIQFCRYIPLFESLGAHVLLEVPKPLMTLMATLKGKYTLIEAGQPLPEFDYHIPIMSLPLAFKTTLATVPAEIPYLKIDARKQKNWQAQLGEKTKPRVGLVWSGSQIHKNDHNRSIPLALFASLLNLPVEFHALQKEIRPEDSMFMENCDVLIDHQKQLADFTDTAALIAEMDWVISVDTSIVHLAGAIGKEVWLLLPYLPDYRWLLDREDTPWYPTVRVFRQSQPNDWTDVIDTLKSEMLKRI